MSINGITLLNEATAVSLTGGTGIVFEDDSTPVATGIRVSDTDETDLRLKKHVTFKNRNAQMQGDGSFSKARKDVILTVPFELADGSISYQVFRGQCELHPEFVAVAANLANFRYLAVQTISDSELDKFYAHGSTR
jgi:hypothetical protein